MAPPRIWQEAAELEGAESLMGKGREGEGGGGCGFKPGNRGSELLVGGRGGNCSHKLAGRQAGGPCQHSTGF